MMIKRALGLLLLFGGGCSAPEPETPPAGNEISGMLAPASTAPGYSAAPPQSSRTAGSLGLSPGLSSAADTVVPPDAAFRVDVTVLDAATLSVHFAVAECCYLYRDKTGFTLSALDGTPLSEGLRLGAVDLPPGEAATDEFFGRTEVYRRGLAVRLPLSGAFPDAGFALHVTYQGCMEKGASFCYEPITRRFPIYGDAGQLTVGAPAKADKQRP